ncbi:MAG: capsular polysaccharide synthesis protein [Oscillospiraceae bacterium]
MEIKTLNTTEELSSYIQNTDNIKVFGAGFICNSFFEFMEQNNFEIKTKINSVMVSSMTGNDDYIESVPVRLFDIDDIKDNENIFIAISYKKANEIISLFEGMNVNIAYMTFAVDYSLDRDVIYDKVKKSVAAFADSYIAKPVADIDISSEKYIWTCWWQGVENAPEIVKACINSQKRNIPNDVNYIIITENNYSEYIDIPNYILDKVQNKYISLTTLSDIIRFSLLYKYGGLWIDSTVFLHKKMPSEWFNYNFFTCKGKDYHFASYSEVSLWFIGGRKGNELFSFVREGFLNYYKYNNKIKYYLMVDYLIQLAFDTIPCLKQQHSEIPYNNENADILKNHLKENYSEQEFKNYLSNSYLQKLTYKFDDLNFSEDSIYSYIVGIYR